MEVCLHSDAKGTDGRDRITDDESCVLVAPDILIDAWPGVQVDDVQVEHLWVGVGLLHVLICTD